MRTTPITGNELARVLFAPRGVALIGASSDPRKAAARPWEYLRRSGYAGAVHLVNRRGGHLNGQSVYTSFDDLPEVPEHAFLMTPTDATLTALEQCGRAGVPVVTVLGSGFGENGPAGAARERELLATARRYGMRVLGPSSLGLVCTRTGLTLTANAAFAEADPPSGGWFVASQSGSMIGALLSRGAARGYGFSHMVSVGGEADLSVGEVCACTVDDPNVTGYLLFLESLRHADELRAFASMAAERGKPVAAYKLGRSAAAAELAVSHTGALAGEDDVAEAFLADCGIARLHTLDGFLEAMPLLRTVAPGNPGQLRSVGLVTTTGGGAAMVVDQLGVRGISVTAPSDATYRRLADAGAVVEPGRIVDLTLAGTRPETVRGAVDVLTSAPEFDLVVVVVGSSARHQPELAVAPLVDGRRTGHPTAIFVVPDAPEALDMLAAAGLPAFRSPESCADAVYAALTRQTPRRPVPVPPPVPQRRGGRIRTLDEMESYTMLGDIGVRVAPATAIPVPVDVTNLPPLRYPVAVKALSAELPHKSDAGGVVLDVATPEQLAEAAIRVRDNVAAATGVRIDRILAQEMVRQLGEVLVGYRIDADIGPLVLVAPGGVLAELQDDRVLRPAPVDLETAKVMLSELTPLRALRGYRGAPHGDLDALADLVVAMSELADRPDVVEAEINPVLVGPVGAGVLAVDAVVRLAVANGDQVERR